VRRIMLVVTVALVMAAMMVAMAMPAFAQASDNANCVGQALSTRATTQPPGSVGSEVSGAAQQEPPGVGQDFTEQTQQPRDACPPL
jgi:hypothetical protein